MLKVNVKINAVNKDIIFFLLFNCEKPPRESPIGPVGDVYISEFGSEAPETTGGKPAPKVGRRVSRIDMRTGQIHTFARNKSGYGASYTGGGGFERPIDVIFDPCGSMYVVDFGLVNPETENEFVPNTGVIWKISRI